jgi:lipoyl-dependent peroxiredoxin
MKTSKAEAVWEGGLTTGNGVMRLPNGQYEGPYTFTSRFQDGKGTNPEELLGAAHAGCFSMALSLILERAGYHPTRIETNANVTVEQVEGGFAITKILLETVGEVPGISAEAFNEQAETAKKGCLVSKVLTGVDIELKAQLKS